MPVELNSGKSALSAVSSFRVVELGKVRGKAGVDSTAKAYPLCWAMWRPSSLPWQNSQPKLEGGPALLPRGRGRISLSLEVPPTAAIAPKWCNSSRFDTAAPTETWHHRIGLWSLRVPDQHCHKRAIRSICAADLVTGPAQAAAPAHVCCATHQLCQSHASLILLVQACTKGVPEAGGRRYEWRQAGLMGGEGGGNGTRPLGHIQSPVRFSPLLAAWTCTCYFAALDPSTLLGYVQLTTGHEDVHPLVLHWVAAAS